MILHVISASPYKEQQLTQCLQRISVKDAVILIQDGVYALNETFIDQHLLPLAGRLYALHEDIIARGLPIDPQPAQSISYDEFVELTLRYDNVLSW